MAQLAIRHGMPALVAAALAFTTACSIDEAARGDVATAGSITIDASRHGLVILDAPYADEGPVGGVVFVANDGAPASDAIVTINGVALTDASDVYGPGAWDAHGAPIEVEAGAPLLIEARVGDALASLTVPCPSDPQIASPVDGQQVRPGETVQVSWSGRTDYTSGQAGFEPMLRMGGYDWDADDSDGRPMEMVPVQKGASTGAIVAPDVETNGYVVGLQIPGDLTTSGENEGLCMRLQRVRLVRGSEPVLD